MNSSPIMAMWISVTLAPLMTLLYSVIPTDLHRPAKPHASSVRLTHSKYTSLSHALTCHSHALVSPYANGQRARSTIRDREVKTPIKAHACGFNWNASQEMATNAPPQKKLKASTGAATYKTKFNPSWQAEFPFVSRSDSIYSFHCNVCRKDVSCSHQGVNDLKRHEKSLAHQNCISATKSNYRLETMGFVPRGGSLDSQVLVLAT